jgi:hypothetical protein
MCNNDIQTAETIRENYQIHKEFKYLGYLTPAHRWDLKIK